MDDVQVITEIEQRRQFFYRILGLCQNKQEIKSLNEILEKLTAYYIQITDEKLMQKYDNDLDERQHQIEVLEQQKKKMQAANKQIDEHKEQKEIQKLLQMKMRRITILKDVLALLSSQEMNLQTQQDKLKDIVKDKKKELQSDRKNTKILEEEISKVINHRENEMKEISRKNLKNRQLIQEEIQKIKKAEKSLKELYIQKKKRLLSQKFKQQVRSQSNSTQFQQGEIRQIKQQSYTQSGKIKIPFDPKQIRKEIQGKLILLVGFTILLICYNLIC